MGIPLCLRSMSSVSTRAAAAAFISPKKVLRVHKVGFKGYMSSVSTRAAAAVFISPKQVGFKGT